ncbi:MAG: glycosyltransferase 87 family protein [Pirellulaceae bacterium]
MSAPLASRDSQPDGEMSAAARWSIYALLIVVAAGLTTARIMRNRSPDAFSPTPFQSANDKSRWCTIRALGDHGIYSIEHIIFYDNGEPVRGWHTIDLVRHRGPDGREHYYSSKPTLLSTLLAGEYRLIKQVTGMSLAVPSQVWFVSRLMLMLTNVVPLVVALYLLARMIDQLGQTDWGRLFSFASAAFATFITTFSSTLNNHSLAACTLVFALAAAIPIWQNRGRWCRFALAGLFFACTAANELPALSLLVLAAGGLAWKSPWRTALAFMPAVLLVAAAAFGTNIFAHGDWRTPYAHRSDGPWVGVISPDYRSNLNDGKFTDDLRMAIAKGRVPNTPASGLVISAAAKITVLDKDFRWKVFDPESEQEFALVSNWIGRDAIHIYRWDNWYDYPGTHWDRKTLTGLDRGESSPLVYAFHCLVGHHGLFSLTPIWLLSALGCWMWLRRGDATTRVLAITTILITLVVLGFYLSRPQIDRNYGGGTCCLRWLVWLTPLWLLTLVPAADWIAKSRGGRAAALALFAVSVFSAHYAADNPWANPWIYNLGEWLGWWHYP